MHFFGLIAFLSTFSLAIVAFIKQSNSTTADFVIYLPYGILIFILNIIYLKIIRLSRESYEEKLKNEKEYSQALLKSQKRFLRYAVHETNTPLAIIMANIELYEMEMGKHSALQNIEAATKNISGIYDDLSYLTQQDKIEYPKRHIILSDFIQSRIHFFNIVAKQSGLIFHIQDTTFKSYIYINETKLQRIIDNNITNALKYSNDEETINIYLSLNDNEVIFTISTSSTMIENTSHIFDAYYRENNARDGLGLGLNLVKRICDEESVNITLTSSKSNTTFNYYFKKVTK